MLMVAEVLQLLTIEITSRRPPATHVHLFPDGEQRRAAFVLELMTPGRCLLRRGRWVPRMTGRSHRRHVLAGVIEVQNGFRKREVSTSEILQPVARIAQR